MPKYQKAKESNYFCKLLSAEIDINHAAWKMINISSTVQNEIHWRLFQECNFKAIPVPTRFKIATLKLALVKRTILLRSSRNSNIEIKVVQG